MKLRNFKTVLGAVFLFTALSTVSISGASLKKADSRSSSYPDFAYPKSVAKEARKTLNESLQHHQDVQALRSLMDLVLADGLISRDSTIAKLPLVDSIAESLDAPYSAIGYLLEAEIYSQIYSANRNLYNQRLEPESSASENPQFWNRELFKQKIFSLIDKALAERSLAEKTSLSDISPLIDKIEDSKDYTLYDFFVYKAIDLRSLFSGTTMIPFFKENLDNPKEDILLVDELLAIHPQPSRARNNAILKKARLLGQEEGAAYLWSQINAEVKSPYSVDLMLDYYTAYIAPKIIGRNSDKYEAEDFKKFWQLLVAQKDRFKSTREGEELQKLTDQICFPEVSLNQPSVVESNKEFAVTADIVNMDSFYLLLLDAGGITQNYATLQQAKRLNILDRKLITTNEKAPFAKTDTVYFSVKKPGKYLVLVSSSPETGELIANSDREAFSVFTASDIDVISINPSYEAVLNARGCFVVNSDNSSPVNGASVEFKTESGRNASRITNVFTGKDGFASSDMNNCSATALFQGSEATCYLYSWPQELAERKDMRLFADRAVYRPGDTVSFMGVVYNTATNKGSILKDVKTEISLYDANYQKVDSLILMSDASGRITGNFKLLETGLLGRWSLRGKIKTGDEASEGFLSSLGFEIAEYKVPSFIVSLEKSETENDTLTFKGTVATYAGMPVNMGKVNYTVNYLPVYLYRWRGQEPQSYSSTATTDMSGEFIIKLPLDNLDKDSYKGFFMIVADVTDEAGETVKSSPLQFVISDIFNISATVPDILNADNNRLKLDVKVYDAIGLPVQKQVNYCITSTDGAKLTGVFESPQFDIDATSLPSGKYNIDFYFENDSITEVKYETVLYRTNDPVPPVETPLWCPADNINVPAGEKEVEITYGSSFKGQNILCYIVDSEGNYEYKWLVSSGKNEILTIPAPDSDTRKYITLYTFKNHKAEVHTVTLIPEIQNRKLEIITESFRNKLTAGEKESWKFRLQFAGKGTEGYAYALLYDKALDAISPLSWSSTLFMPSYPDMISLGHQNAYPLYNNFQRGRYKSLSIPSTSNFAFETYGYPFFPFYFTRAYGARMNSVQAKSRKKDSSSDTIIVEEMEEGVQYMDSAANFAFAEAADDSASDLTAMKTNALSGNSGVTAEDKAEIRPIELPVVFFKPNLTANSDGEIIIDFVTPNFNTTWNLLLGAYTPDLHCAQISQEAVASKSIMVKMNAPRFIRSGDRIILTATLYNNTSDTLSATGSYEIFNPVSGEILQKMESAKTTITPAGNTLIATEFFCPSDIGCLGLRVFGKTDNASDGEETIIPVLPSSQPVVSSMPFYLEPATESWTMDLPKLPKDASITFTYCDNPIWEVVTSLSPIIESDSESVITQLSTFYANCVGSGIMKKYHGIKEGLRHIVSGETGDSLLTSSLSRNEELKIVSLNNTPWINDASSDNLRLSRLSTLLDEKENSIKIANTWTKISALQNSDGGWSWYAGAKSSRWITEKILEGMGSLKSNGYLLSVDNDIEINSSLKAALKYCDSEILDEYYKFGKNSEDSYLRGLWNYLYIRSNYRDAKTSMTFGRLKMKSLEILASDWQKADIYEKATIAILLWRSNYKKAAVEILESLREYAVTDRYGVHYDNLTFSYDNATTLAVTARVIEAFNEIRPNDGIINGLRQWMIYQKQAGMWNSQPASIYAINSLLTTGSEWKGNYSAPTIKVDGKEVPQDKLAQLTGSCKINLNPEDKVITINRTAPVLAWGGVISQFVAPIQDIKAEETDQLSIHKECYRIQEENGALTAIQTDTFDIGDKVRVTLTIDCGRYMEYVVINDERAACLEPVAQLSGYTSSDGIWCYREIRNTATNLMIPVLPRGRHVISYDCFINEKGTFSAGIATIQSLYAPVLTAHSSGVSLTVK